MTFFRPQASRGHLSQWGSPGDTPGHFLRTAGEDLGGHPKPAIGGHLKSGQRDS